MSTPRSGASPTLHVATDTADSADHRVEYWESVMSETYIPLAVSPHVVEGFAGRIAATEFDELLVTSVQAGAQTVRRTQRLVEAAGERYILASMFLSGRGVMHQDGRQAHVSAGDMVFYESGRPYRWEIDEPFDKVVVQVPVPVLVDVAGRPLRAVPSAITIARGHPASAVGTFFRGIARLQGTDPERAAAMAAGHGIDLLASALQMAAGELPDNGQVSAVSRAGVLAFMRQRCADADLTVDTVAAHFAISRRTLYRLFDGEQAPVPALLAMRVERACEVLRSHPGLSMSKVAAAAGFISERNLFRAFHSEMRMTPGEYRERAHSSSTVAGMLGLPVGSA
ncbi:AraC-like ligand-binding domain-containing protein [Nocardia sp. FBN12]|uniref:AraC-like ligand-binding domain-containing protein n=1 Tax=Nocardia sp. FBN12 TaxID=3419766 RepID=UPI003D057DB1